MENDLKKIIRKVVPSPCIVMMSVMFSGKYFHVDRFGIFVFCCV